MNDFLRTVKSQFVAAATNFFGDPLMRPLFEGGYYLRAAIITQFSKNYVKLHQKWTILAIFM